MLLQGFPRKFELRGNFSQQVVQVSNAVPPALAGALAEVLRKTIYDRRAEIQNNLIRWFEQNQRSFPWRRTKDPYKILIAEKLLQQTAATKQVVDTFKKLMKRYPTLDSLAKSQASELRRMIAPLGFGYRSDELRRLAQTVMEVHEGKIPKTLKELLNLPGVGDYAARAVLSFAHRHDFPVVDTNVARLLHRVFGLSRPLSSNPSRDRQLIEMAGQLIPKGKSKQFNLAILDLCASICTSRRPSCFRCPLKGHCEWNKNLSSMPNGNVAKPQRLFS
jgi:A/G-specific adenine glycosylase